MTTPVRIVIPMWVVAQMMARVTSAHVSGCMWQGRVERGAEQRAGDHGAE
jgi:hypothetical protein